MSQTIRHILCLHVGLFLISICTFGQVSVDIVRPMMKPGESTTVIVTVDPGQVCTLYVYGVHTEGIIAFRDTMLILEDPGPDGPETISIPLKVTAIGTGPVTWGQYMIFAEAVGLETGPPHSIVPVEPGKPCDGEVGEGHTEERITVTWQATGRYESFYILITDNDCGKYYTPTTPSPSSGPTSTPTPGPTTGPVITPTPRFSDSEPTEPGETASTDVPADVTGALEDQHPDGYTILYSSGALDAGASQFTGATRTYGYSVPIGEIIAPGSAYTYAICGTAIVNGFGENSTTDIVMTSPRCSRYSPTDSETGEPVEDTPCPKEPICTLKPKELVEPAMDGGLINAFKVKDEKLKRDDFLALGAEGRDFDQLEWECIPSENCQDTKGKKKIPLTGKVKFEWEIIGGEGNFVQLGCLPNLQKDEGDHVIFQPPYVPLPEKPGANNRNKKQTIVLLKVIDDNPTQPIDNTVERRVVITTERQKGSNEDYYYITVESDAYSLPSAPEPEMEDGSCHPKGPKWDNPEDLVEPAEQKPPVADNDKMVVGQWMRLKAADQTDNDHVNVRCISDNCTDSAYDKDYEDDLEWNWEIVKPPKGGYFVTGAEKGHRSKKVKVRSKKVKGRFVIYEAPMELEEDEKFRDIEIEIEVNNPNGIQLKDKTPDKHKFTIRVFKAGIEMQRTPADWLPEKDNFVDLESRLKYHDGTRWQDALAHMCRIHFFELNDITNYKGYCTNAPEEDEASECFDYRLKNENQHEAFNKKNEKTSSRECKEYGEYMPEARTKKPERTYTVKVHSEDYGGFTTLLSHGNINIHNPERQKREEPVYISIPVEDEDHPDGRDKKTIYDDNRVTIPRDIDENHIADLGWTASVGAGRQPDPKDKEVDEDNLPAGDGYDSDGYTGFEEYRGFNVVRPEAGHVRTDMHRKDLTVWNEAEFNIGRFRAQSELIVHEVGEDNLWLKSERYWSNFNSPTFGEYRQAGLKLCDGDARGCSGKNSVLGIAKTITGAIAPPNWVKNVAVYEKRIRKKDLIEDGFITYSDKEQQVVAHELAHATNVYHHGEGSGSGDNINYDVKNGPRSGDLTCIMRYDNLTVMTCQGLTEQERQVRVRGRLRTRKGKPEPVGSVFCTTNLGTGYNAGNQCFGNCATGRGDCKHQFRVSGRDPSYPKR